MPVMWEEKFATGEEKIDGQHKQLFAQLNQLETQLGKNEIDTRIVMNTIQFLKTFARTHFVYEELCMFRHKCPSYEKNLVAHDNFMKVAEQLGQQFADHGATRDLVERTHKTMTDWLKAHICKIDIQLKTVMTVGE